MKTIYGFSMSASSSEIRDALKDGELQKLILSIISSSNAENVSTVFSYFSFSHRGSFIVLILSGYNNIHAEITTKITMFPSFRSLTKLWKMRYSAYSVTRYF